LFVVYLIKQINIYVTVLVFVLCSIWVHIESLKYKKRHA